MLATVLTVALCHTLSAAPTAGPDDLDFWTGTWEMDSSQPTDPATKGAWQAKACTNTVTKEYGGKVVHEDFKTQGFNGGSWSNYDPKSKKWRQTWVDDSGAYLLFEGGMKGKEFVLVQTNAVKGRARMRFANIAQDGFDWYWEKSSDGKAWTLEWHLKYHRVK